MPLAPQSFSNIPIPDPSVITQQIIDKTVENLRRETSKDIAALDKTQTTRIDAIDKASEVLADNVNRVPTLLDREITRIVEMLKRVEALTDEKFSGIGRQIQERDLRTEQDKRTGETAIAAAFQAQKEAAAKSEILTTKLIDGLGAIITNNTKTTDDTLAIINERLARGDGGDKAHSSSQATMIAIAAVIVSLIVGGFSIVSDVRSSGREITVAPAVVPLGQTR